MKRMLVPVLASLSLCSVAQAAEGEKTFTTYCQKAVTQDEERATVEALARLVSVRTPVEAEYCEYLETALAERTRFSLRGKNLISLKAFAYLPYATELVASNNQIKSLEGLEGLNKLETLDVGGNAITQIGALKDLNSLRVLRLQGNDIEDLVPLSGLGALSDLSIGSNRITDVKALSKVKTLEYLNLSNNALESLNGLESLEKLRVLNIGFNRICESDWVEQAEKKGVTVIGKDTQDCSR
ncbi:leucine-rich repeat domain-containing protein [Oligoflexus tunisiensis]|uniref:leucine-rich repeat domain-containing protein n=1 Tax=Oligoflexus tunisiensis TaxID=708132 RepID=UPI00114C9AF6|nr:leucine-rich repeat domain-containing protein [Oligoflexus tunisiensis]